MIALFSDVEVEHPVIHLSLPENLQVTPKTALGAELKKMMQKYRWLTSLSPVQLGSVDAEDIDYLKKLQSDDPAKLRITEAILRISRTLYTYFNQSTVILLIDNYDNTSCRGMINEAEPRYTLEYYKYLNKMISRALLNGTEYISRALITGLTSLPFSLPYCDLSMIRHNVFLENHPFVQFYGYLEKEADELMIKFTMSKDVRTTLLNYYKGYRIRGTDSHIYNPNTIYQYHLHRQRLRLDSRDSLKVHTDPIKELDLFNPFYQMLRFREKILLMSINEYLNLPYDISHYQTGAFEDLGSLKLRKYYESSDQHTHTVLTLFFELGYLKKAEESNDTANQYVWANVEPKISTLLHNGIKRASDQPVTQLQFHAMIYQSIGRRVNAPNAQNVQIISNVPLANRTALTLYDMSVRSPHTKKIIGVIAIRFEKTTEEALNDARSYKFKINQLAKNVKYIGINVIEENQPLQVDALVHVESYP
ncbi:hypothetical protein U1Q18_051093 [Sarracenia purpurea var. burkii]